MGKLNDLSGQKFGRLTVLSRANKTDSSGNVYWNCLCDCGNSCVASGNNLKRHKSKSCGCHQKEQVSNRNIKNLVGMKFGKLTVISRAPNKGKQVAWNCICECNNECVVTSHGLLNGTKSCGCLRTVGVTTHGMSRDKWFKCWYSMIRRCFSPEDSHYKNWGGRGIKVCERWLNFENYLVDISQLEHFAEPGYTLDRIDVNGNYCPENIRFANAKEQSRNNSNNIIVNYKDTDMLLIEASEISGILYKTLLRRYHHGDRGERLFRPVKPHCQASHADIHNPKEVQEP